MDKVYVIFRGQYSDWRVGGFFKDEENAAKYCALKNKNLSDEDEDDEGFYYLELKSINADLSNINVNYSYHINFRFFKGSWTLTEDDCDFTKKGYMGTIKDLKLTHCKNKWFCIEVTAKNDNCARKIAYDILARYKSSLIDNGVEGTEKLMNIGK